jgi:hypothetical protein
VSSTTTTTWHPYIVQLACCGASISLFRFAKLPSSYFYYYPPFLFAYLPFPTPNLRPSSLFLFHAVTPVFTLPTAASY